MVKKIKIRILVIMDSHKMSLISEVSTASELTPFPLSNDDFRFYCRAIFPRVNLKFHYQDTDITLEVPNRLVPIYQVFPYMQESYLYLKYVLEMRKIKIPGNPTKAYIAIRLEQWDQTYHNQNIKTNLRWKPALKTLPVSTSWQ